MRSPNRIFWGATTRKGSNLWNGLVNNWEAFRANLSWQVGNGEDTHFWLDTWLPYGNNLLSLAVIPITEEDSKLDFSHFTTYSGDCNWGLFENLLPENIISELANFPPPSVLLDDDNFTWGATPDGRFTTKSANLTLTSGNSSNPQFNFKYIWRWKGNERIRTFLWKFVHEVVLTNVERRRRTMTNDALCLICRVEEETLFHRFRDCPARLAIWDYLRVRNQGFYSSLNLNNWLESNLSNAANQMVVANWSTLFGVTLDLLWRNRNDFIFSQKSNTTLASVLKIRHHVEGILDCMHICSILNTQIRTFAVADDENWTPPPVNFVKLNTDGSVRENGRVAGCGGVVRDELGVFIFAFSHHLHNCNSLEAELNGILHGLKLVWQRNLKNVIVETDSLEALEVIVGGHHEAAHI